MPLNLVQHRAEPNVWDRVDRDYDWDTERWLAGIISGAVLISGLRRRSLSGLVMVLGAASLGWWAAGASEERHRRRGSLRSVLPGSRPASDVIGEASEQSFPASDAPAWTPTTGNTSTCSNDDRTRQSR